MISDVVDVAMFVGDALDRVGIGYFLGGSLASSMQGEPRATNDINFVLDLAIEQIGPLAAAFGRDVELDHDALRTAVRAHASCNGFYLPLSTKLDFFVLGQSPFDRAEFERRQRVVVRDDRSLIVKTPEDTVLRKLLWYREGGEVSSKQWRDVIEVLRVSGPGIDNVYLEGWSQRLSLGELLARARAAAASSSAVD